MCVLKRVTAVERHNCRAAVAREMHIPTSPAHATSFHLQCTRQRLPTRCNAVTGTFQCARAPARGCRAESGAPSGAGSWSHPTASSAA